MNQPPGEITRLLNQATSGDKPAFEMLVSMVYDELHRIAEGRLALEQPGHTLAPTALVHEAYEQLVKEQRVEWDSRSHFFAVASLAMRRILINYAKTKARRLAGDSGHSDTPLPFADEQADELIALDSALTDMREFNEEGADVVQYRYFGGLQFQEIGEVLGVPEAVVRRRWAAARAWLKSGMGEPPK